ncbi:TonB-dependent receptor [Arachidicoccus terrestris]|uniref:TonB-dependent receptor n=1 Tax=Arachidicoccus terrestris TaxID=2875539 RepID=UPI001CC62358|nr:TonB-dependent receptor plug domain-containing protein [Arachidicoccus terrestris]UAY54881.1 TonB-dependent receptor [Arachidicoccus terrestris]
MKRFCVILCPLLGVVLMGLMPLLSEAQQVVLEGRIINTDRQPVESATVRFQEINKNDSGKIIADNNGHFSLRLQKHSKYKITIEAIGYEPSSPEIRTSNGLLDKVFFLTPITKALDPLEVRAIRAADHAPFAKTNINAAEIQEKNLGRDLPYLLNQTPGVVVNSDAGNGIGYTGIHIRGSDASRTNVTLNGIPYNDAESSGSYFVDMPDIASSINSIQVQRGVGTSSNGAGAFGATINISTNQVHQLPYATLSNSYGSYNSWKNTVAAGSGLIDGKFTADIRLSHISSDGYIDRASSKLESLLFSTAYVGKNTTVRFNFITGKEKTYQAWNGVPQDHIKDDPTYNELGYIEATDSYYANQTDNYTQSHYQLFINHSFNAAWSFSLASFLTRGIGYYEEYENNENYTDYGIKPVDTLSTDLIRRKYLDNYFYGQTFSLQWKQTNDLFTLGGAWTNYDGGHYGRVIWAANGGMTPEYEYYNTPAYKYDKNVYLKWMHDFADYWHLFADMQYRHVWHKMKGFSGHPDLKVERKFDFYNPKVGISYAKNGYNAYLSYALANKEPNRDDFEAGLTHQPKREQLHDFELGMEKKAGKYFYAIGLYYMRYKDQLVLTGQLNDVGEATRINVPNSYRAGIELQANYKFVNWMDAAFNLSLSKNKIDKYTAYYTAYDNDWNELDPIIETQHNTDIAYSPNIVGGASISFHPVDAMTLSLEGKYVGRQYVDNTQNKDRSLEGYYNQDIRVVYQLSGNWFKRFQLIGQVYNLFSTKYFTNGATYPEYEGGAINNWLYYFPAAPIHFMAGVQMDL